MSSHLKLVHDRQAVVDFYKDVLDDTPNDTAHMVSMFARRKYLKGDEDELLKYSMSTTSCIDRRVVRRAESSTTKGQERWEFLREILKYEIPEPGYISRGSNMYIPDYTLAIYSTVNPRNLVRAGKKFSLELYTRFLDRNVDYAKIDSLYRSIVQKEKHKTEFMDLDVDYKIGAFNDWDDIIQEMFSHYFKVETRGGYHYLLPLCGVRKSKRDKWYNELSEYVDIACRAMGSVSAVELKNDALCPVPGTIQGGFKVPHHILWEDPNG